MSRVNQFATIHTIYRCEVEVPRKVYDAFGHLPEYDRFSCNLSQLCNVVSGSTTYTDTIEWGESAIREQVERFAKAWEEQIAKWEDQIK